MDASKITSKNYSISGHSDLVLKLYHVTDEAGIAGIHRTQMMKAGSKGMLGGGMYFAETPDQAKDKAKHRGFLLEVLVRVGWIIVLDREVNHGLTKDMLRAVGCDSVKSVGHNTGNEYVVYDPDQIIAAWIVEGVPDAPKLVFPGPEGDDRPLCVYGKSCERCNPQHFVEHRHSCPPVFKVDLPAPGQRSLCPEGQRCRNKSVEHFKSYSHPPCVALPQLPSSHTQRPYRIASSTRIIEYEIRSSGYQHRGNAYANREPGDSDSSDDDDDVRYYHTRQISSNDFNLLDSIVHTSFSNFLAMNKSYFDQF